MLNDLMIDQTSIDSDNVVSNWMNF